MKLGSPFLPRRARIEIVPLIDVMFFLLAAFMMVSLTLQRLRTLRADLPNASTAGPGETLVVQLGADGGIAIAGQPVSLVDLPDRLRSTDPDRPVFLRPEGRTTHERVIQILDIVRGAGIRRAAIAIDSAPPIP